MNRLVIYILALLMTSCIYQKITHMDSDDMIWLDAYHINDTIVFGSTKNNTDTMIIVSKIIKNSKFPFYISTYSSEYLASGVIRFNIHQSSTDDTIKCTVWFDKYYKNLPVIQSFAFGGFKSMIDQWLVPRQRRLWNVIIDNKSFNDCIIVDSDNPLCDTTNHYEKNDIRKFIWSKKDGLLMYELTNGELFTLTKKISHN